VLNLPADHLLCGRYRLPIAGADYRPLVMGILNVTLILFLMVGSSRHWISLLPMPSR